MRLLPYLFILSLSAAWLWINIDKPFIGQHDWNGVVYGQQARNYLRYGYLKLGFAPVNNAGIVNEDAEFVYDNHYPPLLPILLSFSFRIFGVHEWSARLVPVIFSLATVVMVIKLGKMFGAAASGYRAGLLMSVTPMFIYYGKMTVHEILILPLVLAGFYFYFRWRDSGGNRNLVGSILSLITAQLVGWPGYYPALIIFIYHLFTASSNTKWQMAPLLGLSAGMFGLFLIYSFRLDESQVGDLVNIFLMRIGAGSRASAWPFTWIDFLEMQLRYSVNLMTLTLLLLSGAWLFRLMVKILRPKIRKNDIRVLMLGIFAFIHIMLFRNLAWLHEYMLFYTLPFLAISASLLLGEVLTSLKMQKFGWVIFSLVFATVGLERRNFARALLRSEYAQELYIEAVRINQTTMISDLVRSNVPIGNAGALFNFYADRKVQ